MTTPHWRKVGLIFRREVRDQFRDRRTLFTVGVLPLLLYPMLGIGFLQVSQFLKKHPSRILFIAQPAEDAILRALATEGSVAGGVLDAEYFDVQFWKVHTPSLDDVRPQATEFVRRGRFDVVAIVQPNQHTSVRVLPSTPITAASIPVADAPQLPFDTDLVYNSAKDRSRVARQRLCEVLEAWRKNPDGQLASGPPSVPAPQPDSDIRAHDLAEAQSLNAAVWSKVLPFIVFVWALTGAFYPAIDLCAGEKERGTLETLLSSAAERIDIVWGKLLTTMLFSAATAVLNMACMLATASFVARQFAGLMGAGTLPVLGPPPWTALVWLLLALIPIAALFSSLALALASMARSAKEGQYYLMPLIMGFTPLMMLAMLPTGQLDLGTSLLPVTGLMLLLRHVMEGELLQVWFYILPVFGVTYGCCHVAIRWAVHQFSNEELLFRPGERFSVGTWFRQLLRDRSATPSISEALLCGLIILFVRFFVGMTAAPPKDWNGFVHFTTVSLLAFVAAPPLLMATVLTNNLRATLLIQRSPRWSILAAVLLAVALHPFAVAVTVVVRRLYPMDERFLQPLQQLLESAPGMWQILVIMALLPAMCEEVAFRGFILSGLRHAGTKWQAIAISSIFFGIAHGVLQQSIVATVFGFVLGFLAVHTGSIVPCIAFHATHNALGILASDWLPRLETLTSNTHWLVFSIRDGTNTGPLLVYGTLIVVPSACLAVWLLKWFRELPFLPTDEERLQSAIEQNAMAVAST